LVDDSRLASLKAASCTYRIALGPRAGQKVLSVRTVGWREETPRKAWCADAHGFSLHAAVRLGSHQRKELERLCRTITRPALASERLIRFHGVLAPNAKLRAAVIPQAARKDSAPGQEHTHDQAARMRWARLLKRVFHIDVERCACGGQLKILAAVEEPVAIVRILTHLGMPARAPPRAAAREFSLDYAA
jgi:hypothetical protein